MSNVGVCLPAEEGLLLSWWSDVWMMGGWRGVCFGWDVYCGSVLEGHGCGVVIIVVIIIVVIIVFVIAVF